MRPGNHMPPQSAAVRPATSCCLLIAVFKPTFCSRLAVSPHGPPPIPPPPTHPSLFPLQDFDTLMAWDTNPLYALLHESIYCQGAASNWAAHRVRCAPRCTALAEFCAAGACCQSLHSCLPQQLSQTCLPAHSLLWHISVCLAHLAAGRVSLGRSLMPWQRPTAGGPSCSQVGGWRVHCAPPTCQESALDACF